MGCPTCGTELPVLERYVTLCHECGWNLRAPDTASPKPPPDALVISASFNAEWAVLGWRRRRTLTLGLPLLTVLPPQPRAALIAHELAHARNGDSTRGFFVGGAINALSTWYGILGPQEEVIA